MTRLISMKTTVLLPAMGAFLCGFVGASSPAFAQASPPSSGAMEQVIITSPYVVRREPVPRAAGLNNPQLVVVSRGVSYADLDLSKPAGVAELQTRARNTAKDVCLELMRLYPKAGGQYVYSSTDCGKKTTDDGMDLIKQ